MKAKRGVCAKVGNLDSLRTCNSGVVAFNGNTVCLADCFKEDIIAVCYGNLYVIPIELVSDINKLVDAGNGKRGDGKDGNGCGRLHGNYVLGEGVTLGNDLGSACIAGSTSIEHHTILGAGRLERDLALSPSVSLLLYIIGFV